MLQGKVFLELREGNPDRFLNLCQHKNLPIFDFYETQQNESHFYTLKMYARDYKKLSVILRKTKCRVRIKKKLGPIFLFGKYRNRLVFLMGGIYFLWFLFVLTTYLWSIEIEGGFCHTKEEMLHYLKENQIMVRQKISRIHCSDIEKKIRLDYPDITWVSVERKGSKLLVSLKEVSQIKKDETYDAPCDLCATTDGIVETILCEQGTAMVHKGDSVKKGDVLISGLIQIQNEYGEEISSSYVCAKGIIKLKCIKKYTYRLPALRIEKQYTKNERKGVEIQWKNKKIISFLSRKTKGQYDIIKSDFSMTFLDSIGIPLAFKQIELCEYQEVYTPNTEKELQVIAQEKHKQYITYLKTNNLTVLSDRFTITSDADGLQSNGKIVVIAPEYEAVLLSVEERVEQP